MPPKMHVQAEDAQDTTEQARDLRKPKKKGQEQTVAAADAAGAAEGGKEAAIASDSRRTKTAGEALLRPSATDGLIARASKISTPALIDKKGTALAALRRTRGVPGAEGGGAKTQEEIDRCLKVFVGFPQLQRPQLQLHRTLTRWRRTRGITPTTRTATGILCRLTICRCASACLFFTSCLTTSTSHAAAP